MRVLVLISLRKVYIKQQRNHFGGVKSNNYKPTLKVPIQTSTRSFGAVHIEQLHLMEFRLNIMNYIDM